jgi:NADH-quinone oxidoreductase subunit M
VEHSFLLSLFVFAPVIGMIAVFCVPSKRADIIKTVASAAAAIPLLIGAYMFFTFNDDGKIHYYESIPWIGGLNVYYKLGMDGISAPMVVLSGLVGFIAVVASWGIEKQIKGYFALILLLLTGMNGVFCATDFFLFYVFWELMLLPMYFLIGIWGGPKRVYAAIKFFLYTMAGSVLMLVVLLAAWYWSDGSYSSPQDVANAKVAVYENHKDVLKGVYALQTVKNAPANELEIADLMRKSQLDLPTSNEYKTNLHAYIQKFIDYDKNPTSETARAAIPLERTFDLLQLKARYSLFLGGFNLFGKNFDFALLMFVFLYIAFAIKVPVFPFHTWLPWAHVEAPTAISVILAGILLKMGVYGFFRIAYPMFPTAAIYFAVPIAMFGVLNIIYGACCAMAQDDLKKIVAYSSVSHMGYCMLGLAALTKYGMTGSILQMFNHGTSTSMMFLLVGVIYDRAHHRDVNKFGGLAAQLPVYAGIFTVALFASMGLPGLSGFISEILVFLGAFNSNLGAHDLGGGVSSMLQISFASMTIISAFGVVLTAAYLLWMMQRVFFGPLNEKYKGYSDLSGRELFTLVPLVIVVIALGIYPRPLIDLTQNSVQVVQQHVLKSQKIEYAERHVGETPAHAEAKTPEKHPAEDVAVKTPVTVSEKEKAVAVAPANEIHAEGAR